VSTESHHIVHKLIVEVETNSKEKGIALKDNAAGFVSGSLSPVLEELFEELEKKLNGRILTLESLSIQVSAVSTDLTYSDINRLIGSAIREEIEAQIPLAAESIPENSSEQLMSVTKRQLQSVFHFLRTGTRPWWIPNNASLNQVMETANLLELARTDTETLVRELDLSHSEPFLKRMLLQLPEPVLIEWFKRAFHFPEKLPEMLAKIPVRFPIEAVKKRWWVTLFQGFHEFRQTGRISPDKAEKLLALTAIRQETDQETLIRFIRSITGEAISLEPQKMLQILEDNKKKQPSFEDEKKVERDKKTDEPQTADFHTPLENAGLILLHPFLNPFSPRSDYWKEISSPILNSLYTYFIFWLLDARTPGNMNFNLKNSFVGFLKTNPFGKSFLCQKK
jgi:hypothetical protein